MSTDPFTEAARAEAERRFVITPDYWGHTASERVRIFREATEWARTHLAAQEPQVTIVQEEGRPATCEVRQGGVLVFSGRDHSADVRIAAQKPTEGEVEAAARALNLRGWTCFSGAHEPGEYDDCESCRVVCDNLARETLHAARQARTEGR